MSYYDPLETRDPAEREEDLMDKLARQVAHAKETTSHYFRLLAGINPFEVVTRDALARLPLTRKRDLMELQKKAPPFGIPNDQWPPRIIVPIDPSPVPPKQTESPPRFRSSNRQLCAPSSQSPVISVRLPIMS